MGISRRLPPLLACAAVAAALPALARGQDIPVYTAPPIEPVSPAPTLTLRKPTVPRHVTLAYFLHAWRTWVPGTSYTTPGYLHTSTGTGVSGRLVIRADHSYTWAGHRGRWRATGENDYPLVLAHAVDGHNWKVGADARHRIVIWDGYSYYDGRL